MSSFFTKLERLHHKTVSLQTKGPIFSLLRFFLWLSSGFFFLGTGFAKLPYILGVRKPFRSKAFTISVGNIVAGGTGKTPFTIFLTKQLLPDLPTAILLRGYKSRKESSCESIEISSLDAKEVGDEACVISRHVPDASIYVGKKRTKSAQLAEEKGIECLLLDDGMQHLALFRDVEIVIIDALHPFGSSYLLPRGFLREPPIALERAHLIVLNRSDMVENSDSIVEMLQTYSRAPIIKARLASSGIFDFSDAPYPLPKGSKVALFCGIAKPEQFEKQMKNQGFEVIHTHFVGDHERLTDQEFEQFHQISQNKGAQVLLCTEKDRVKIQASSKMQLPLLWSQVGIEIVEGKEIFERLLLEWKAQAKEATYRKAAY